MATVPKRRDYAVDANGGTILEGEDPEGPLSEWSGGYVCIHGCHLDSCGFGLAEPALSEPLPGDVRVPGSDVEPTHELVDGVRHHFPSPHPLK